MQRLETRLKLQRHWIINFFEVSFNIKRTYLIEFHRYSFPPWIHLLISFLPLFHFNFCNNNFNLLYNHRFNIPLAITFNKKKVERPLFLRSISKRWNRTMKSLGVGLILTLLDIVWLMCFSQNQANMLNIIELLVQSNQHFKIFSHSQMTLSGSNELKRMASLHA